MEMWTWKLQTNSWNPFLMGKLIHSFLLPKWPWHFGLCWYCNWWVTDGLIWCGCWVLWKQRPDNAAGGGKKGRSDWRSWQLLPSVHVRLWLHEVAVAVCSYMTEQESASDCKLRICSSTGICRNRWRFHFVQGNQFFDLFGPCTIRNFSLSGNVFLIQNAFSLFLLESCILKATLYPV